MCTGTDEESFESNNDERERLLTQREDVRTSVYTAFSGNIYPGEEAIMEGAGHAPQAYNFVGKNWKEVDPNQIVDE